MASRPPAKFEFSLLQFLSQNKPMPVRDIYEQFGKANGYIRGTIVKAMDRLLKKGLVERESRHGVFFYSARMNQEQLDRQQVESFIRDRLGGRLGPIAAFLADDTGIDPKEIERLRASLDGKKS